MSIIPFQLQTRLNKLGVALSHGRRDILIRLVGGHFMDKAVDVVKNHRTLRGTGDNWDIRILANHIRLDNSNDDLHLFATNLLENRIDFSSLSLNNIKFNSIRDIPSRNFTPNIEEWKTYISNSKVILGRILLQFFPEFKFLSKSMPKHIPHDYTKEMSLKSNIISMPIIEANETKYKDVVHILKTYEKWITEIYQEAGSLDGNMNSVNSEEEVDSEFKGMKVLFGGDQLTRVRFSGAKDLLAGSHTPTDRLVHCYPFKCEMWHTKASCLQYCYHMLYDPESVNQPGTIKYFREKLGRKNCTPKKVLDCYEGSEDLFLSIGKSYIVVAAMHFFGMKTFNDKPSTHKFPINLIHAPQNEKNEYFDKVMTEFCDTYLLQKNLDFSSEDYVENYALCFIFLTIMILQLKDTTKEGDGYRNLINQKMLLKIFKSLGAYSKYAIEMFHNIALCEGILPEKLTEEIKWGYFCNWKGGNGNNIENDLAQEISNKISKNIVQRMGPNKSISSISKICKATGGIKEVVDNFDNCTGKIRNSSRHTISSSVEDEKEIVKDILLLKPFQHTPGRMHESFPNIKRSPLRYLKVNEFYKWLDKHKKEHFT